MARPPKAGILPVSQKDLAAYLGISPTMMALSQGKGSSRNLGSTANLRLANLQNTHLQLKKSKKNYGQVFRPYQLKEMAAQAKSMETDGDWYQARAGQLQKKLDLVKEKHETAKQWMISIEHLLEKLPGNKGSKAERIWLNNQHAVTTENLELTGPVVQLKLNMEIELMQAKASISRSAAGELRKLISS